jgi:hypothetical protein
VGLALVLFLQTLLFEKPSREDDVSLLSLSTSIFLTLPCSFSLFQLHYLTRSRQRKIEKRDRNNFPCGCDYGSGSRLVISMLLLKERFRHFNVFSSSLFDFPYLSSSFPFHPLCFLQFERQISNINSKNTKTILNPSSTKTMGLGGGIALPISKRYLQAFMNPLNSFVFDIYCPFPLLLPILSIHAVRNVQVEN